MARAVPLILSVVLLWGPPPPVRGYSSGLIPAACGSMAPDHGTPPQPGPSPYTVTCDRMTYREGDTITVQLRSPSSTPFKGFMLQAREVGSDVPLGSFAVEGGLAQLLTCSQAPNSSVSHTSSEDKTSVSATWTAAVSKEPRPIEFRASFVQHFTVVWVKESSVVLNYSGGLPDTTPTPVAPTLPGASGSVPPPPILSISSSGCGLTKVCFSRPPGCNPAGDPACYFMSASVSSPGGSEARFEMKGPSLGYVSFGFSDDQIMGNDDIYVCVLDASGLVRVQHAYSVGKRKPNTLPLGNVSDVLGSSQDGAISCSFSSRNPISTQRRVTGFDASYFLLYAYGPASNGEINFHTGKFSSSEKVDISKFQVVTSAGKPRSVKAHGALMLIAWMTTASLGMMVARFLRNVAQTHRPLGKAIWFLAHVSLMSLSMLAVSVAFIVIFVYVRGWSGGAHPVLGCVVTVLAFLQILGTSLRCAPEHGLRYIFNWLHRLNGLVIKTLAVASVFTGLLLFDGSEEQTLVKVMIAFVVWEAIFFLSLEIYSHCQRKGLEIDVPKTDAVPLALLALFSLGNLSFLVAMLVGIGAA